MAIQLEGLPMKLLPPILGFIVITGGTSVLADTSAQGFSEGFKDCVEVILDPEMPLARADEINGDWDSGFIAWYNDDDGKSLFGIRLGRQNAGDEIVYSCNAAPAMGPFQDEYEVKDAMPIAADVAEKGFVPLDVPIEGDFFADCTKDDPSVLIAIQFDDTRRTGFKIIRSITVADSCEKFGPK